MYPNAGQVVEGLDVAISSMQEGATARITVHSGLGYGAGGADCAVGHVPPHAVLVYTVELITCQQVGQILFLPRLFLLRLSGGQWTGLEHACHSAPMG